MVAALVGVPGSEHTTYEGQAAIELELLAAESGRDTGSYPVRLLRDGNLWVIDTNEIVAAVVTDLRARSSRGEIAARFHRTMAESILVTCTHLQADDAVNTVALSGGTFQNMLLLNLTTELLQNAGFRVYRHRRVPTNDGGLAFGQAVLANHVVRRMAG